MIASAGILLILGLLILQTSLIVSIQDTKESQSSSQLIKGSDELDNMSENDKIVAYFENIEPNLVTDMSFFDLVESLSNSDSINFDFSRNKKLTPAGLTRLGQTLSNLNNLTSLTLNFEGCELLTSRRGENKAWIPFFEHLSNLQGLSTLSLNVKNTSFSDEYFAELSRTLANLKNLTSVTLALRSEYSYYSALGADSCFKQLGESLSQLKSLTSIIIDFESDKQGFDQAARKKELFKNLDAKQIEDYAQSGFLPPVDNEKDNGFIKLSESLSNFKNLTSIVLRLQNNQLVTDDSVAKLGVAFTNLQNLTEITLDFRGISTLTDISLMQLKTALSELKSLKLLILHLDGTSVKSEVKKLVRQSFKDGGVQVYID